MRVDSPYFDEQGNRLGRDRVQRVVDTIALMLRARQIDARQEAAARKVQDAWALAPGSIRCALTAAEGGGGIKGSPTETQLWAGGVLNDVDRKLGELDGAVVLRICGMGFSVEETARMVFAVPSTKKATERETKHIGMRLRMGLAVLARHWHPKAEKVGALRGGPVSPDARPTISEDHPVSVQPGRVVHSDDVMPKRGASHRAR